MSELRGHRVGFEEPAPAALLIRAVVVVIGLKMVLADEQLAEDVEGSVSIHVQSEEPLPQSVRVAEWEPVEGEVRPLRAYAALDAASVNHGCDEKHTSLIKLLRGKREPRLQGAPQVGAMISSPARSCSSSPRPVAATDQLLAAKHCLHVAKWRKCDDRNVHLNKLRESSSSSDECVLI